MDDNALLFVYGTLRRGGGHHHLLGDAEYLGTWVSGPHYRMLDMGQYPALVMGGGTVAGEVYRIHRDILPALDLYEGCPGDYQRVGVETPYGEAWVYLWDRGVPAVPVIRDGDWLGRLARR
jgi:gamma-glutamylcyclotransferase (GGCT)/AIG2-like uncharacterized protein YtfP